MSRRSKWLLLLALGGGLLVGLLVVGVAWQYYALWGPEAARWLGIAMDTLQSVNPVLYFLIMAILPVVPMPTLPLYLGIGLFPLHMAIPGMLFAIPVNLALSYWLAAGVLRPLAEATARRVNYQLPVVSEKNAASVTLLLRVSGLPYSAQNYLSALAGVPFKTFMLVSVPMQLAFASACMLLGESFIKGKGGIALLSFSGLVALVIVFRLLRGWLEQKKMAVKPKAPCETQVAP